MTICEKIIKAICDRADGILINSDVNRLYVTSFDYSDGYALITAKNSYLLTDFRYVEAAKKEANKEFTVLTMEKDTFTTLFKENGVKRLMYEDSRLTCSELEVFKRLYPQIEFIPSGSIIEDMREYKSDVELEYIVKAQRIAEDALTELIENLDMNMTEKEAAAYLEYLMKKKGADGIAFSTIAISGKASSLPHGVPRNVKLEKGFLTFDFGAVYKGYRSDMTRTFCIGKADSEMKKVYNTVLEAQKRALEAIFSGERNCCNIDKISRDYIYSAGYEGCFGHGLGHGVGLEIHEAPRLSPKAKKDKILKHGDVVTVEPGIYIENKYGVRIEDMVYIGEKAPLNLTNFEKNLIEI